jgi:hypothetical protein
MDDSNELILQGSSEMDDREIDTETPVVQFLQNAWRIHRRLRLKLTRASDIRTLERVIRLEQDLGAYEFRSRALEYLRQDSEWLRENKWPLAAFLKQVEQVSSGPAMRKAALVARPSAASAVEGDDDELEAPRYPKPSRAPRKAAEVPKPEYPEPLPPAAAAEPPQEQAEGQAQEPAKPRQKRELPYAAKRWNEIVTAGQPVLQWTHRDRGNPDDPDFLEVLDEVLAICQRIHQQRGQDAAWLTFHWLLRLDAKRGIENWHRVLTKGRAWANPREGEARPRFSLAAPAARPESPQVKSEPAPAPELKPDPTPAKPPKKPKIILPPYVLEEVREVDPDELLKGGEIL